MCMRWWILESERVIDDLEFVRDELIWIDLDVEEGTDAKIKREERDG